MKKRGSKVAGEKERRRILKLKRLRMGKSLPLFQAICVKTQQTHDLGMRKRDFFFPNFSKKEKGEIKRGQGEREKRGKSFR